MSDENLQTNMYPFSKSLWIRFLLHVVQFSLKCNKDGNLSQPNNLDSWIACGFPVAQLCGVLVESWVCLLGQESWLGWDFLTYSPEKMITF